MRASRGDGTGAGGEQSWSEGQRATRSTAKLRGWIGQVPMQYRSFAVVVCAISKCSIFTIKVGVASLMAGRVPGARGAVVWCGCGEGCYAMLTWLALVG
jgi:hypothetical protein